MNMPKAEVVFEAGGQTYIFKFGTYSMAILQRKTGVPIGRYIESRPEWGADECLLIFTACLFQKHKLTEEQVGEILDEIGFERAGEIIHEALVSSLPTEVEAANGGTTRPRKAATAKHGISTSS